MPAPRGTTGVRVPVAKRNTACTSSIVRGRHDRRAAGRPPSGARTHRRAPRPSTPAGSVRTRSPSSARRPRRRRLARQFTHESRRRHVRFPLVESGAGATLGSWTPPTPIKFAERYRALCSTGRPVRRPVHRGRALDGHLLPAELPRRAPRSAQRELLPHRGGRPRGWPARLQALPARRGARLPDWNLRDDLRQPRDAPHHGRRGRARGRARARRATRLHRRATSPACWRPSSARDRSRSRAHRAQTARALAHLDRPCPPPTWRSPSGFAQHPPVQRHDRAPSTRPPRWSYAPSPAGAPPRPGPPRARSDHPPAARPSAVRRAPGVLSPPHAGHLIPGRVEVILTTPSSRRRLRLPGGLAPGRRPDSNGVRP